MNLSSIESIAFQILGYPLSYLELAGTLFGLVSVYLAARLSILTWATGIANELCFFALFFQVQLYSDMLLQVFFLVVSVYGWIYWRAPKSEKSLQRISPSQATGLLACLIAGTAALGLLTSRFHVLAPGLFERAAAFPFIDAFTTVASMLALLLLARRTVECWLLWIAVDAVSIGLYYAKGIQLVALEYALFLGIASFGLMTWRREWRAQAVE